MEKAESPARARFAALMERDEIPLAEAALAVAAEEYPRLDPGGYLVRLDGLGERVGRCLGSSSGPHAVLDAMKTVLFREEGFRGNEADYYDPRNSFLNEVLDRRLGIPITLSILYVEVARRVGLGLLGVAFPGHFLVKSPASGPTPDLFIDPFNGGDVLAATECVARFQAVLKGREFDPSFLDPVDTRHILLRMLHNLKKIYVEKADDVRALWVIDRLLLVQPDSLEERRDRGLLSARLGGTKAAVKDLEAYLAGAPQASDAKEVASLLRDLKRRTSWLN
ncbi:MAG TPA: transglutaminase-like domain-containing protein [Anaeromyxobacteraceae bacterium]|nr:transglutaminase-like domain-containing protein [Anaeromyxobacteraceae bacterium]